MKKTYYEKASDDVILECEKFISSNLNIKNDHEIYSKALKLSIRLITSLLDSHTEFDECVKKEFEKINNCDDGPKKEYLISVFNNKNISLFLDKNAHIILKKLEEIQKNNRKNE